MKWLVMAGLFMALASWPGEVKAQEIEVICGGDASCLTSRWLEFDLNSGSYNSVVCRNNDCAIDGWDRTNSDGETFSVTCKAGGCFTAGWVRLDLNTSPPHMDSDVSCNRQTEIDCLVNGWRVPQGMPVPAFGVPGEENPVSFSCVENDCRNKGWFVTSRGNPVAAILCKKAGCFAEGWYVYFWRAVNASAGQYTQSNEARDSD